MSLRTLTLSALLGLSLTWMLPVAVAQSTPETQPLATRGGISVTGADLEAKFGDLAESDRIVSLQDTNRLAMLIDSTLLTLQMADKGREAGLDQDPLIRRQMELAAMEILADHALRLQLQHTETGDRAKALEAYAREQYLANRESFNIPPVVQVRHLLIANEGRSSMEQEAQAQALLKQAKEGADFEALVMEHSDDGSKRNNRGLIDVTPDDRIDPTFADAARALTNDMPYSGIVRTAYGVHILKLERRTEGRERSFDEVKDSLIISLERRFEENRKQKALAELRADAPSHDEDAIGAFLDSLSDRQRRLAESAKAE